MFTISALGSSLPRPHLPETWSFAEKENSGKNGNHPSYQRKEVITKQAQRHAADSLTRLFLCIFSLHGFKPSPPCSFFKEENEIMSLWFNSELASCCSVTEPESFRPFKTLLSTICPQLTRQLTSLFKCSTAQHLTMLQTPWLCDSDLSWAVPSVWNSLPQSTQNLLSPISCHEHCPCLSNTKVWVLSHCASWNVTGRGRGLGVNVSQSCYRVCGQEHQACSKQAARHSGQ